MSTVNLLIIFKQQADFLNDQTNETPKTFVPVRTQQQR
jgi:hypothetical protein